LEEQQKEMKKTILMLSLALGVGGVANAALLEGVFNTKGTVTISNGGSTIDFVPTATGLDGQVTVGTADGSFAAAAGLGGAQKDILGIAPGAINIANFITLAAYPTYSFTATNVNAGVFSSTCAGGGAGATCTPNDVFNLANLAANSSTLSFVVTGTVTDGSGDPASEFLAIFSLPYSSKSYSQVISDYTKGSISTSVSASFFVTPPAAVPEPSTTMLMGGALAMVGLVGRRFRAKV